MPHPLSAKRHQRFREAVFRRDHGLCTLCGLDCGRLQAVLDSDLYRYHYNEIRKILREHGLPAPARGYRVWQIDHVVPITRGGRTLLSNLRLLCLTCHKAVTKDLKKQLVTVPDKIRDLEINRAHGQS